MIKKKFFFLLLSISFLGFHSFPLFANNWTQKFPSNIPPSRDNSAIAWDGEQCVFFGGSSSSSTFDDDTWEWDNNWIENLSSAPPPRYGHSMSWNGSNKALLFGGVTTDGRSNATWEFDGTLQTWTDVTPISGNPTPRWISSMAWDGTQIILFGGRSGDVGYLDQTWSWNGAEWTQLSPAQAPSGRNLAAMSWNGGNKIILFGGDDGSNILNDTWSWDGTTWTQLSPSLIPPKREAAMMTWDGKNVVLFGGLGEFGNLNDTYIWDNETASWIEISSLTPPPARSFSIFSWIGGDQAVLFSGIGDSEPLQDTWIWGSSAPTLIKKKIIKNQKGYFYKFRWNDLDTTVIKYRIYRGSKLIKTVKASDFLKYKDGPFPLKRKKTYKVIAVYKFNYLSDPLIIHFERSEEAVKR